MMADATEAGTSDVTYDLDGDGNQADENDHDTAERGIRGCGRAGVGGREAVFFPSPSSLFVVTIL